MLLVNIFSECCVYGFLFCSHEVCSGEGDRFVEKLPTEFAKEFVVLFAVTIGACCDDIVPGFCPSEAFGDNVVDGVAPFAAVGTGPVVAFVDECFWQCVVGVASLDCVVLECVVVDVVCEHDDFWHHDFDAGGADGGFCVFDGDGFS